jgi:hypothetical protein
MTRTIEVKIYQYDELPTPKAKERARDWFREGNQQSYDWWDAIYEDAKEVAARLGVDLGTKEVKLMSGKSRYDPAIYFTGFSSQGDGACFEGKWEAKLVPTKAPDEASGSMDPYAYFEEAIKDHAPQDEMLQAIAREFDKARAFKTEEPGEHPEARCKHSGHYYHSGCMDVETNLASSEEHTKLRDALRMFANWIYEQLRREDEYLNEDTTVEDNIRANKYEFNEDGTRA